MVLYEIYREDGGNGITFVHMLYKQTITNPFVVLYYKQTNPSSHQNLLT
jgi:hypothetical protein